MERIRYDFEINVEKDFENITIIAIEINGFCDKRRIGYINAKRNEKEGIKYIQLDHFEIEPAYRRKRVGTILFSVFLRFVKEKRIADYIIVYPQPMYEQTNMEINSFYLSLKFNPTKEETWDINEPRQEMKFLLIK